MTVYLVGAGPGDPELLSVRLLRPADVVLHDRLAWPLLGLAQAGAEVIDVCKEPGAAPVPQEEINRLLIEQGRRRGCVVRLKGGDPFVFARGAEEAMALKAAGIAFEIVPGISSVVAAPAAAGVPLTWRGVSRGFTVLTGHENPDRWAPGYAEALVSFAGTIVVVMATAHITQIAARLVEAGLDPQTPTVAVKSATTSAQVVRRATLATIESALLDPPSLFVIGDVAGLDLRPAPPGA